MKRNLLLDEELVALNQLRSERGMKQLKHGLMPTSAELEIIQSSREEFNRTMFKLGSRVIQKKRFYGLPAGRMGWIISEWPRTIIEFDDGLTTHMSAELSTVIEPTGEFRKMSGGTAG